MTAHEAGKWEGASEVSPETEQPTPLMMPLPRATEVPIADLGPLIGPVTAIATLTQASPALALNAVLAAISVCAQGHADAQTLDGQSPLSLFSLSIAGSGERKSAVDAHATRPIREFEAPLLRKYATDLKRFEEAQNAPRRRKADPLIEDEYDDALDASTYPPVDPKIVFDDITFEGLAAHFENGRPSIGILSDEGGKIFGGYAMSPQHRLASAAGLSQLWDGKAINRTRASKRSVPLPGRRTALHIAVQPAAAENLIRDREIFDQGLLSRMLTAQPDSMKGYRKLSRDPETLRKRQEAEESLTDYHHRLTRLLERDVPHVDDSSLELAPRRLGLDAGAYDRLFDFFNLVEDQQREDGRLHRISGFASKAPEQAARIAGNLALYDDPDATSISVDQMKTAIAIMLYFIDEAVRIFDTGRVSQRVQEAETLRKWLVERHKDDIVDIRTCVRLGPNPLREATKIRDLLRLLQELGWVTPLEGSHTVCGKTSNSAFLINRPA
ncbi:MAG: YfjI family protein [Silicimonas sp.]